MSLFISDATKLKSSSTMDSVGRLTSEEKQGIKKFSHHHFFSDEKQIKKFQGQLRFKIIGGAVTFGRTYLVSLVKQSIFRYLKLTISPTDSGNTMHNTHNTEFSQLRKTYYLFTHSCMLYEILTIAIHITHYLKFRLQGIHITGKTSKPITYDLLHLSLEFQS